MRKLEINHFFFADYHKLFPLIKAIFGILIMSF